MSEDSISKELQRSLITGALPTCVYLYVLILETLLYKVFAGNSSWKLIFHSTKISPQSCTLKIKHFYLNVLEEHGLQ